MANIAAEYLNGVHIGASIAQERQRIAAERNRAQMEAQARAETNQREYLMEQARTQTQQAYQQAQLGLRQRALDQAQQENQQRTQDAALRMADQHGFDQAIAAGAPAMEAMAKFPRASSTAAIAEQKENREARSGETRENRLQSHETEMERIARAGLSLRDQAAQRAENKPVRIGETESKDESGPITTTTRSYQFGQPGQMPVPPRAAKPVASPPEILPLPDKKQDLKKGLPYQTHKGVRVWDGRNFVLQAAAAPEAESAVE